MSKIAEIKERAEDAKKNHDYLAGLEPQTILNLCSALEYAKTIISWYIPGAEADNCFSRIDQILDRDAD